MKKLFFATVATIGFAALSLPVFAADAAQPVRALNNAGDTSTTASTSSTATDGGSHFFKKFLLRRIAASKATSTSASASDSGSFLSRLRRHIASR